MISKSHDDYCTPSELQIEDFINLNRAKQMGRDTTLDKLSSSKEDQQRIQHLWNRMSGGSVIPESPDEFSDKQFFDELGTIKLGEHQTNSILDYATYSIYRQKQEESNDNQGNGPKSKGEIAKDLKDELEKLLEMADSGDFDENGMPYDGEGDGDGEEDGEEDSSDQKGNEDGKEDEAGKGNGSTTFQKLRNIYDNTLGDLTWLIARDMDNFVPEISVDNTKLMESIEGSERMSRQMKDITEITSVNPMDLAMPKVILANNIATNSLTIHKRANGQLRKQFVYLLVDCSGSMQDYCSIPAYKKYKRIEVAKAVTKHFVKRVRDESSVIMFRGFRGHCDDSRFPLIKASSKKDVAKFNESVEKIITPGGGTSIQNALQVAFHDIDQWKLDNLNEMEPPEIILLTDGGDEVYLNKMPSNYKLNYIDVAGYLNDDIVRLADKTIRI